MASIDKSTECIITTWGVAAFAGFVAMVMLHLSGYMGPLQAVFMGGLAGTVLGLLLSLTLCRPQTAAADLADDAEKPAMRYAAEAAERKAARVAASMETATAQPAAAPAPTTSTAAPAAVKTAAPATATTAPKTAAKTAAAPKATAKVAKTPAAKATPARKAKAAPKAAAAAPAAQGDAKPATMLSAARSEGKDDLKLISGVGPKLEETLNDLGVYHFDQVAKWQADDIEWVDSRLRFKGRITRDDWMSQARILASGGETEFSKKKK